MYAQSLVCIISHSIYLFIDWHFFLSLSAIGNFVGWALFTVVDEFFVLVSLVVKWIIAIYCCVDGFLLRKLWLNVVVVVVVVVFLSFNSDGVFQ